MVTAFKTPKRQRPTPHGPYASDRPYMGAIPHRKILEDPWFDDQSPLGWSKNKKFDSIHHFYRDLIQLRGDWKDNTCGLRGREFQVHHVNNADKLVAFHPWEGGSLGDDVPSYDVQVTTML